MNIREKILKLTRTTCLGCKYGKDCNYFEVEPLTMLCKADVDLIISLETDTERIAIVLKEPVLPENLYHSGEEVDPHWVYEACQQDMLKAGFVQLKEGE